MGAKKASKTRPGTLRGARKAIVQARRAHAGRWWSLAATGVVAAFLAVVVISAMKAGGRSGPELADTALSNPPATATVGRDTAPPWSVPHDASAAVRAAGLPMLDSEGAVEHIHAHLDVLVDGRPVSVPTDIGIDRRRGTISPLHTHDASGVIHIESPVRRQFSLGEFFTEWDVSLSDNNIGALRTAGGKALRVFVNGIPRTGNPAAITFGPHDEIAVIYGAIRPGETVPSKFDFPVGE